MQQKSTFWTRPTAIKLSNINDKRSLKVLSFARSRALSVNGCR
ncbi:MAG TPA: hypothetical protein V6D48_12670 [Oculatellaceae cyanobacterium]